MEGASKVIKTVFLTKSEKTKRTHPPNRTEALFARVLAERLRRLTTNLAASSQPPMHLFPWSRVSSST